MNKFHNKKGYGVRNNKILTFNGRTVWEGNQAIIRKKQESDGDFLTRTFFYIDKYKENPQLKPDCQKT